MLNKNIMLNTDSYKVSMWKQYPPGTEYVFSYVESRGGKFDRVLFFGLQAFIKEYLSEPITKEMINEADEFWTAHGEPFNREGWEYILDTYEGYLPVHIKAVPEGMVVDNLNVLATIENTDPKCFWLTTWLETAILRAIWYPTTVATLSKAIKDTIQEAIEESSVNPETINFKLHDFGKRGVSSYESSGIGGMAHLVNFMGTDTITGALFAKKYYGINMAGFSIPAAEHSTITAWGRENEEAAYANMIAQFKDNPLVAVVSDSYDIFNAAKNIWGDKLKAKVVDGTPTVVIRPDSGVPSIVVLKLLRILGEQFGYEYNIKGYRVLNDKVRVIQGDGVNLESIKDIIETILDAGWSIDNVNFGMGGALLQQVDRDTQKFAMKCSAIKVGKYWRDVYKAPITDLGKKSKAGRQDLVKSSEGPMYKTVKSGNGSSILETVFYNGNCLYDKYTFQEIRERANKYSVLNAYKNKSVLPY